MRPRRRNPPAPGAGLQTARGRRDGPVRPGPARARSCTEIYGGPQTARVVGTLKGKRVWASFGRVNGCQISRWQGVSPWLLPPGGAT